MLIVANKNGRQGGEFFQEVKNALFARENDYTKFDFQQVDFQDSNLLQQAKAAHAILFFAEDKQEDIAVETLRVNLGLYAQISTLLYQTDGLNHSLSIVQDKNGGIYFGEKGFSNNPSFGREAYDVERYSELEIERTARVGYEFANDSLRKLALCDKADKLTTSKLWRKIVADLNEDYPFVSVDMQDVTKTVEDIISNPTSLDVIVTTALFGDILTATSSCALKTIPSISFVCDTPLAMYGFFAANTRYAKTPYADAPNATPQGATPLPIDLPTVKSLINFILKNSFGIE